MKPPLSIAIFAATYALLMPLALGVLALWQPLRSLVTAANAPAWVQAIGSIGAIITGFGVAAWQRSEARRAEADRFARAELEMKERILFYAGMATSCLVNVEAALKFGGFKSPGQIRVLLNVVDNNVVALDAFNPTIADIIVIQQYIGARGLLRVASDRIAEALTVADEYPFTTQDQAAGLLQPLSTLLTEARSTLVQVERRLGLRLEDYENADVSGA